MGRTLRKVKKGWVHPKESFTNRWGHTDYRYRPLLDHDPVDYNEGEDIEDRVGPEHFMPQWGDSERTVFLIYEDTSEGTPLSDREFDTPEEAAQFAFEAKLSAFGSETGTLEWWESVLCYGGFSGLIMLVPDADQ